MARSKSPDARRHRPPAAPCEANVRSGVTSLPAFRRRALPPFPGSLKALGPGIVWLALAQGSGELIWWPSIVARYGLAFLFLLVPACLIKWPVNYAIGRHTILTGESILRGFLRMS